MPRKRFTPEQVIAKLREAEVLLSKGQPGPSCRDLTRELEEALGTPVADRRTSEFHQPDRQDHRQQTGR